MVLLLVGFLNAYNQDSFFSCHMVPPSFSILGIYNKLANLQESVLFLRHANNIHVQDNLIFPNLSLLLFWYVKFSLLLEEVENVKFEGTNFLAAD